MWPAGSRRALERVLADTEYVVFPDDGDLIKKVGFPSRTVVVGKEASLQAITKLVGLGFEHIVQRTRKDFPAELLASALMTLRPAAFVANPMPFFFNGFSVPDEKASGSTQETHIELSLRSSQEKDYARGRLEAFLAQDSRLSGIQDLVLQAAEELMTNAFYSGPVRPDGSRPFQNLDRRTKVDLPGKQVVNLFAHYSDYRLVVGCQDPFGSLERARLVDVFRDVIREDKIVPKAGTGGAGMGFRYMVENSANFYVLVDSGVRTIVACGFLLQGQRANLSANKHVHLAFEQRQLVIG